MRTSGYVPNFKAPSKSSPSNLMWLIVVLCVFLPPLGLIMLWARARNPLRGKLIVSIIALLSMTLMLTIYISLTRNSNYQMQVAPPPFQTTPQVPAGQTADPAPIETPAAAYPDATPVPASPGR